MKRMKWWISLGISLILSYFCMYYVTSEVISRIYQGSSRYLGIVQILILVVQTVCINILMDYILLRKTVMWKVRFVFICYLIVMLILLFGRNYGYRAWNLNPFALLNFGMMNTILNVLNLILFIPLGYFFRRTAKKKVLFVIIAVVLMIEVLQYITYTGIFDITDMILNTLGIWIGYIIFNHIKMPR